MVRIRPVSRPARILDVSRVVNAPVALAVIVRRGRILVSVLFGQLHMIAIAVLVQSADVTVLKIGFNSRAPGVQVDL